MENSGVDKLLCKSPACIAETMSTSVSFKKVNASFAKIGLLGILAGAYIGFGAALATLVGHDISHFLGVGIAKLITGAVFSVGLMLVVIAGAELFTGNNLMLMGVLDSRISVLKLIEKWVLVYVANFIGSILLAWIMFNTDLWKVNGGVVGIKALAIANAKVNLTFSQALFRAIGCNWLVCLAVWMAFASPQVIGKIFAIFFPIMAFVALGFEHCVANMYFIPMGIFLKSTAIATAAKIDLSSLTWNAFFVKNLLPVTIGNIIGGAGFVGMLYWFIYIKGSNKK